MKKIQLLILALTLNLALFAQTIHFDQIIIDETGIYNGLNGTNKLELGNIGFNLDTTAWSTWTGWTISKTRDTITGDYTNSTTVMTGYGTYKSSNYAVSYGKPAIKLTNASVLKGTYINNTVYTYNVIKNGNAFTKDQKGFGGIDGNDPDYLLVRAIGYNSKQITDSTDFYLADYRFNQNNFDYIVDKWTYWDLSSLGSVDSVSFKVVGSDVGQYGLNTPAYFAIDDFNVPNPNNNPVVKSEIEAGNLLMDSFNNGKNNGGSIDFEAVVFRNNYNETYNSWSGFAHSTMTDTTTSGYQNQYAAITGSGLTDNSYLTANTYGKTEINLPYVAEGNAISGFYVTNSTYAALSMLNGDKFAKKFGGDDGNDPDYFRLIATGYDYNNNITGYDTFYLADFRFDDNNLDYIIDEWTWFDLSKLGDKLVKITCQLESSDESAFGMNTPGYFCLDNFNLKLIGTESQENKHNNISAYPNPFINNINIVSDNNGICTLLNLKSQVIKQQSITKGINTINIENNIPKGLYFLKIETKTETFIQKIIKL